MSDRLYRLTYGVDKYPDGITAADVERMGMGAADAVIIHSMIYPEDGSFSLKTLSLDGRTQEDVTDEELWKVWTLVAHQLVDSTTLGRGKRMLAAAVIDAVRENVLGPERTRELRKQHPIV